MYGRAADKNVAVVGRLATVSVSGGERCLRCRTKGFAECELPLDNTSCVQCRVDHQSCAQNPEAAGPVASSSRLPMAKKRVPTRSPLQIRIPRRAAAPPIEPEEEGGDKAKEGEGNVEEEKRSVEEEERSELEEE